METGPHSYALVAVAANQPPPVTAHHHHLREAVSPGSRDSITPYTFVNWPWFVFKHEHPPPLASVPTDCHPLLGWETSTLASGNQNPLFEQRFSFTEKYGRCKKFLHYGISSTIRLYENQRPTLGSKTKQLLAIKVYRYSISGMAPTSPTRTISSLSLTDVYPRHPNIVPILDILCNERSELCVVMPYCAGGNLRALISRKGPLAPIEADCLFAQILRALTFLHRHDTAHQNVRLETILLTAHGAVKLAGFGDKHIRMLWEKCAMTQEPDQGNLSPQRLHHRRWTMGSFSLSWPLFGFSQSQLSSPRSPGVIIHSPSASLPGVSRPYLSPEAFNRHSRGSIRRDDADNDDLRPADIWAVAIVYMALITGHVPWSSTCRYCEDSRYLEYLRCRAGQDGYPPIEMLGKVRLFRSSSLKTALTSILI